MNKGLQNSSIKVCNADKCIEAKGRLGKQVADATTVMLVLFGIAALFKAVSK